MPPTIKGQDPQPICRACRRLRAPDTCDAFPDGIPRRILAEHFDHREPYPGDRGFRFEPVRAKESELARFEAVTRILHELSAG